MALPLRGLLVALGLTAGLTVAPLASVAACDCAMTQLPQAIRDADAAFVGVLTGTDRPVPAVAAGEPQEIAWTWQVERSRDPMSATSVALVAWPDDGANCGVAFGVDERWLVIGSLEDGRLHTNGCMRNQRLDGTDPDGEAIIASLVSVAVGPRPAPEAIPMPLLLLGAGAAVLAVISILAFRRGGR